MADEIVYRLIAGEGIQLVEDSSTATVTVSVPSLSDKINVGDIGQATAVNSGLVELATAAEARALSDAVRVLTPATLAAVTQDSPADATINRLLKVGSFGLGSTTPSTYNDWGVIPMATAFFAVEAAAANKPANISAVPLVGVAISMQSTGVVYLVASSEPAATSFAIVRRTPGGVWQPAYAIWSAGNFDPNSKANITGTYPGLTAGNADTVNGQSAAMLAPPGQKGEFFRSTPPPGWLAANGAAVSRTTYAALFQAIGTIHGAGNGTTTFNLPDGRGEFFRGWDNSRGIDPGRVFGSVQLSQNLSHSHGPLTPNGNFLVLVPSGGNQLISGGGANPNINATGATAAEGGAEARPRNMAVLVCIKY